MEAPPLSSPESAAQTLRGWGRSQRLVELDFPKKPGDPRERLRKRSRGQTNLRDDRKSQIVLSLDRGPT